ncbi:hypothetical protein M569_07808, partial [Genlisea aurea]
DDENGGEAGDDLSKIEINHEYAKRYEHNKKREELQRYEELKKRGQICSSDSESEDDTLLIKPSKRNDLKFFDALIKVKNQDPILGDKDAKLFTSDSESGDSSSDDEEKENIDKRKKKKPVYLKDVVSQHLLEEGPEFGDDDEMHPAFQKKEKVKSYSEEQEELRREFLKAVEEEDSDEGGDFLTLKKSEIGDDNEPEDDDFRGKLDEYFGDDDKLDADTLFLKDYFRERMWFDDGKGKDLAKDEIELSEDEDEIEKQEDYEREFNFRFEENAGDRVLGHSRKVEGSVRKKENPRRSQRDRKEERILQAELERKEELKRLKNLKKKEINEKLEKIRDVAGISKDGNVFLSVDDLDDEFDPDAYDRKMKEAFGDSYYDAEDADPGFGSDGDDLNEEDEELGLGNASSGFLNTRDKILKNQEAVDDAKEVGGEGGKKRKRRSEGQEIGELEKAVRDQLMEEYYKLDYEDTIGDLKTRFKYKSVKAKRYGLRPDEVLSMDDKDLNQYVSLKKLAPYQEKEWKVPRIKTVQLREKKKEGKEERRGSNNSKEKRRGDD